MTALISFHEAAEVELNEAAQYYESEVRGLGKAFLNEVNRALKQIRDYPEASQVNDQPTIMNSYALLR